jgi:hypothetical protein
MMAKLTDRERWQGDLSVMAAAAITTDALGRFDFLMDFGPRGRASG